MFEKNENIMKIYGALWQLNMGCDIVYHDTDFSKYKVIVAPMLFMLKKDVKDKIYKFVENGGIFVTTFASGVVDEDALSFFDDECYPFRKLLGVKQEETDSLYDNQYNYVEMYGEKYIVRKYCELGILEDADVIGRYTEDFYKGMPAVTVKNYGKGKAFYIAANFDLDGYMPRTCIERIFNKLLDCRCRSFNDLARGNKIGDGKVQYVYFSHIRLRQSVIFLSS